MEYNYRMKSNNKEASPVENAAFTVARGFGILGVVLGAAKTLEQVSLGLAGQPNLFVVFAFLTALAVGLTPKRNR